MMKNYLAEGHGPALVKKVGAVFGFSVLEKKGGKVIASYGIDLKNGDGAIYYELPKKTDCTFTMP